MVQARRVVPLKAVALAITCAICIAAPPRKVDASPSGCPSSIVYLYSYHASEPFPVDSPTYDTTFVDINTAHIEFDRTVGEMSLAANSGGRLFAEVRVIERFDVTGVPPGTPVTALIQFRLDGWAQYDCGGSGCGVALVGTLTVGPDSVSANASFSGPRRIYLPLVTSLTIPVTFHAGTPVRAEFFLGYESAPGADLTEASVAASYGVIGLPPGVRAIACYGADVTPVRKATWGELKSIYR